MCAILEEKILREENFRVLEKIVEVSKKFLTLLRLFTHSCFLPDIQQRKSKINKKNRYAINTTLYTIAIGDKVSQCHVFFFLILKARDWLRDKLE